MISHFLPVGLVIDGTYCGILGYWRSRVSDWPIIDEMWVTHQGTTLFRRISLCIKEKLGKSRDQEIPLRRREYIGIKGKCRRGSPLMASAGAANWIFYALSLAHSDSWKWGVPSLVRPVSVPLGDSQDGDGINTKMPMSRRSPDLTTPQPLIVERN